MRRRDTARMECWQTMCNAEANRPFFVPYHGANYLCICHGFANSPLSQQQLNYMHAPIVRSYSSHTANRLFPHQNASHHSIVWYGEEEEGCICEMIRCNHCWCAYTYSMCANIMQLHLVRCCTKCGETSEFAIRFANERHKSLYLCTWHGSLLEMIMFLSARTFHTMYQFK